MENLIKRDSGDDDPRPVVIDRADGPHGELVLRQAGDDYEIISNGVFLMDTRNGESERLLVSAAADRLGAGHREMLIGGLGVGFSLDEALRRRCTVTVVERLEPVVTWHRGPLKRFTSGALDDPGCELVTGDLVEWLRGTTRGFDAICLDIDNGPDWTVVPGNGFLYGPAGIDLLARRLRRGGVLTVWSAAASTAFVKLLRHHFNDVTVLDVPVPRGEPDVVFVAQRD